MINTYKLPVEYRENYRKYVVPYTTESDNLIKLDSLKLIENYKSIRGIEKLDNAGLKVIDTDGCNFTITGDIYNNNLKSDRDTLFVHLVKSIDYNIDVNFYKVNDKTVYFYRDTKVVELKKQVDLYNSLLKITGNYLVVDFTNKPTDTSLIKMLEYFKMFNIDVYNAIMDKNLTMNKINSLFDMAKYNMNGITFQDTNIHEY